MVRYLCGNINPEVDKGIWPSYPHKARHIGGYILNRFWYLLLCLGAISRQNYRSVDILKHALFITVAVYIGLGVLLYLGQSAFIYFPTPEVKLRGLQVMQLSSDGVRVNVHVVNPGNSQALIYFGGNAEAVAFNAPEFSRFFPDHTVYLMNFRGYGGSEGKPRESVLYQDALSLYDEVNSDHEHISAMGRSLGSGIATYLAAERELARLVLITPFDSLVNVAFSHYPIYPVSIMLREQYDSLSRVPHISEETLILIAEQDRIIKPAHAHELARAFPSGQATTVILPGTGHNSVDASEQYYQVIRNFLSHDQQG